MSNGLRKKIRLNKNKQRNIEAKRHEQHMKYIAEYQRRYLLIAIIFAVESAIILFRMNIWVELVLQLVVLVFLLVVVVLGIRNRR